VFIYVTATWPNANATAVENGVGENEAVIWDEIVTSPSADHLTNLGPVKLRKLIASAKGKSIDPNRYEFYFTSFCLLWS
jgi:signal peptidase complex subunit 3